MQKVGVMGKVVCYDVLEMCTKILELYDSHCSAPFLDYSRVNKFCRLKKNDISRAVKSKNIWLDGRLIISRLLKGIESLNRA